MSAVNRTGVMFAVVFLGLCVRPAVSAEPPGLGPAGDLQRIEFEAAGPTTLVGRNAQSAAAGHGCVFQRSAARSDAWRGLQCGGTGSAGR